MFAQGAGWQLLRAQALTAIPDGAQLPNSSPVQVADWITTGTFIVSSMSNKGISTEASHYEIAAALLSEASFFLDHAAEHSATFRNQLASQSWYSPAWLHVTLYYWGFFAAQAISRLRGSTPLWLSKVDVKNLATLGGYTGPSPGAGPYELQIGPSLSASMAQVAINKAKTSRVHDLLWRRTLALFADMKKATTANSDEARIFGALEVAAKQFGDAWPSDLRNLVNYSPGAGYSTVRRNKQIVQLGFIGTDPSVPVATAINRLETNCANILQKGLSGNEELACKIMVDLVLILDAMSITLYQELVLRRNLDRRWLNARDKFYRDRFRTYQFMKWPFAA